MVEGLIRHLSAQTTFKKLRFAKDIRSSTIILEIFYSNVIIHPDTTMQ